MISNSPSIIILIPYFGNWPFWMPFFLESCRHNPDIDWLLIGDCEVIDNLPPNVRFNQISFSDYCSHISKCLNLEFAPTNPYKLCDLKPALGYIHQQQISAYDFWGFSDIDLIYGKLRHYFNVQRLARYKLLSTHSRRVSGHFCLMRNEQRMLEAFNYIPNWKQRISDPQHRALDEGGFSRIFLWRKNFPKPLHDFVGLFNRWRRESEFVEAYSTPNTKKRWIDSSLNFPQQWTWDKGSLTNDINGLREFPYLHFMRWKKHEWHSAEKSPEKIQKLIQEERWSIDDSGFHAIK